MTRAPVLHASATRLPPFLLLLLLQWCARPALHVSSRSPRFPRPLGPGVARAGAGLCATLQACLQLVGAHSGHLSLRGCATSLRSVKKRSCFLFETLLPGL